MTAPTTSPIATAPSAEVQARPPHAEFMQIWEEGYLSNHISYENMHTPGLLLVEGAGLRQPDGKLDRVRILAYVEATIASNPQFRIRLQRAPLGLTPPAWVPDEHFDLSRHILFADTVEDAATADLRKLSGAYDGVMPLQHPLWRMRVTELSDGRVAIGTMMHHASLDGLSGMKTMSSISQKKPDDALPAPTDPFAGYRASRTWRLPLLALTQWWTRQSSPADAWRSFWTKPLHRRARRVAARIALPLRYGRGGAAARERLLPPRHSAFRQLDAPLAGRRARQLGGTLSDLQVAAMIGAWDGPERHVSLRYPVSFHSPDAAHIRNHIRDMQLHGDVDADIDTTVASVHEQVATRDASAPFPAVPGHPIGYSTLLPWVSSPRYFCGGEVLAIVPFPASLGTDQFAVAGIMYNGSLFVGANMPVERDVERAIGRVYELMTGMPDPGRT